MPQFEAFCQHAQLATLLPLDQVILLGDRKMPTEENQLAWLQLGVGYIGPVTMQANHRQTLLQLLKAGRRWTELPYVAQREVHKAAADRTVYRGLSHMVTLTNPETEKKYQVRHLYIHSSALAQREANC